MYFEVAFILANSADSDEMLHVWVYTVSVPVFSMYNLLTCQNLVGYFYHPEDRLTPSLLAATFVVC